MWLFHQIDVLNTNERKKNKTFPYLFTSVEGESKNSVPFLLVILRGLFSQKRYGCFKTLPWFCINFFSNNLFKPDSTLSSIHPAIFNFRLIRKAFRKSFALIWSSLSFLFFYIFTITYSFCDFHFPPSIFLFAIKNINDFSNLGKLTKFQLGSNSYWGSLKWRYDTLKKL